MMANRSFSPSESDTSFPHVSKDTRHELTYLELYSGIGGWGFALHEACQRVLSKGNVGKEILLHRMAALDRSDIANQVFKYNFSSVSHRSSSNKTIAIETLSISQLTSTHRADVWVMSPPCQPYTRNNEVPADETDERSNSFLHLCRILGNSKDFSEEALPKLILMENVIGFESSNCCKIWRYTLLKRGYSIGHFHLTPTQVNIPNDRPRYYCVAVFSRSRSVKELANIVHLEQPPSHTLEAHDNVTATDDLPPFVDQLLKHADLHIASPPNINTSIPLLGVHEVISDEVVLPPIREFLDSDIPPLGTATGIKLQSLRISSKLFQSSASWCFDIVLENDTRPTACFTHSYGKFVRGTGSILYTGNVKSTNCGQRSTSPVGDTSEEQDEVEQRRSKCQKFDLVDPKDRVFDGDWAKDISVEDLRYFSGTEIGRLMGFPMSADNSGDASERNDSKKQGPVFRFPPTCSIKSQWKLLGNSLNVRVAARVAELGLHLLFADDDSVSINE